jgi:hypothetical protein
MRLGHRAGNSISFIDSFSEETILKVESLVENKDLFTYHLYDNTGSLVAEVESVSAMPDGIEVRTTEGELLLQVTPELGTAINYRLYSRKGALITCSDGERTQIFGGLQIAGSRAFARHPRTSLVEPATAAES